MKKMDNNLTNLTLRTESLSAIPSPGLGNHFENENDEQ